MWQQISKNQWRSFFASSLIGILFAVFGLAVVFCIYPDANLTFIIYSLIIFFGVYIYLLIKAKNDPDEAIFGEDAYLYEKSVDPRLYNIVQEMQIASGLDVVPKIYILDTDAMNAFACGIISKKSSIYVTKGLLETLNRSELQAVIAHEVAHIKNKDTSLLLSCGVGVMIMGMLSEAFLDGFSKSSRRRCSSSSKGDGLIIIIALLVMFLAALCSKILYFFVSREREFLADACATKYTRYPEALASALSKISKSYKRNICKKNPLVKASCIVPFYKKKNENGFFDGLFSTHPDTKKRIEILLNLKGADYNSYNESYSFITGKKAIINSKDIASNKRISFKALPIAEETFSEEKIEKKVEKRRNTEDLMWKLADYIFIKCDCATTLKVPPSYKGELVQCPHCKIVHKV